MNTYKAFYKGHQIEVRAETSYKAQQAAAIAFKAKKRSAVTVVLVAKGDKQITHSPEALT